MLNNLFTFALTWGHYIIAIALLISPLNPIISGATFAWLLFYCSVVGFVDLALLSPDLQRTYKKLLDEKVNSISSQTFFWSAMFSLGVLFFIFYSSYFIIGYTTTSFVFALTTVILYVQSYRILRSNFDD